jgi:hypothetical protein
MVSGPTADGVWLKKPNDLLHGSLLIGEVETSDLFDEVSLPRLRIPSPSPVGRKSLA